MAVSYGEIIKQIALRSGVGGSVVGSDMATIEANYNQANFGASHVDNASFPFSAMKDAVLLAEERIAQTVASVKNHALRIYLRGTSDALANRAALPDSDSSGDPVIGVIGAVRDATDNRILTDDKTVVEIERLIRLGAGALKTKHYFYQIVGATILHTRTNVLAEVCKYNKATQKALVNSNGAILFPDALEEMYVSGAIAAMFREDEAPETVKVYMEYFASGLKRLEGGEI